MTARTRTAWRLAADGQYTRQIGWTISRSGKRVQPKFRLGANRQEAKRRDQIIRQLWDQLEASAATAPVCWTEDALAAAKTAAATGRAVIRPSRMDDEHICEYVGRVTELQSAFNGTAVEAADEEAYRQGKLLWAAGADMAKWINYVQRGKFELPELHSKILHRPRENDGPALHDALRAYSTWLEDEYADPARGVTPWGRTQMRQVSILVARHSDRPLSELDYAGVEELIRYWRRRPASRSKGSSGPIAKKTAENLIKTLRAFLKWLHRAESFDWRRPENLDDIKTRVEVVESDRKPQVSADDLFTVDELATLYKYATPLERTFLLLSLNCHFGQAEISSLLVGEVFLRTPHSKKIQEILGHVGTQSDSFIRRHRRKTGVYGEWILFPHTVKALEWAVERRREHADFGEGARVMLNSKGQPYDTPTATGNANQQIANRFADLVRRIQNDGQRGFAKRAFKMVRKTAATMIREIADGEIQGLFTSHGQPVTTDDLADVYAVRPFGKLFVAIRKLQERLQPVFDGPFEVQPQSYTLLRNREAVLKMARDGAPVWKIVNELGIARATVYRHLSTVM